MASGPVIESQCIAVVGAGAIGCALLPRVARMRISELRIIDGDRVEERNLERQPLYADVDIGHSKAHTARGWMQMGAPGVDVIAVDRFVDANNALEILRGASLVADCTDDLHAKQFLDRACAELRIPLVSGAVHEKEGQVLVLHAPGANGSMTRADVFTGRIGPEQDGCDMQRVPEATIEAVGQRMAACIHAILRNTPQVNGRIELFTRGNWSIFDPA